ncbi:hypothetical protein [Thiobacter aerophilum]|uniref:Uncharacterized protein n=1 Tax=Thiobacter aerophilum TaxID=3121275 RepID=A0ABV0EJM6_9BURK
MNHPVLAKAYRAIPFRMACELHQRLRSGCTSPETRKMLREALQKAGVARRLMA